MQAKRYRYIDSLKGISCLMVMFCHYICVLKYATEMTVLDVSIIQRFAQSNFGILIDEDFWLQLFFVASGFLLIQAKIESIADLINKSCNRFLRFYLPILSACCIIYTMGKTMGFPISDTKALFACKWFQQYYPREFVWKDLIIDPIKTVLYAGSLFNGPYWVISMMFYSSLLIYLLSYLFRKQKKQAYLFLSVLAFAFAAGLLISKVIFGCLIGAATGILAKHCLEITDQFKRKKARIVFCVLIVVVAFLPLGLHRFLTERLDVAFLQYQNNTYGVVYWALIVFLISRLDNFNLNKSREYIYIYNG